MDVRAYDANDLVTWLGQSEEVTEWLLGVMEKSPNAIQVSGKIDATHAIVQSISKTVEGLVKQADSSPVQNSEHQEVLEVLERATDYSQQGLILTARTRLKEIEHEAAQLPEDLRFRYLTKLAFCELSGYRFSEAASLLEEAYELQPENSTAIANASLAARIQQDFEQALALAQQAHAIDPKDPIVAGNLMASLREMGQDSQLEDFIATNGWMRFEQDSAEALAKIRMQQNRYEEAEEIYRTLVETYPDDPHVYAGLSQCLVARAQEDRTTTLYSDSLERILLEAESMASQAIKILSPTQLVAQRHEALLLRTYALSRLGKIDEAMHDVDSVLNESPESQNAIQQKGILLLRKGSAEEARSWLERIQDPEIRANSLLPLADAYLESGDTETAITLLKDSFSLDPPEIEDLVRAQSLMRAENKARCKDTVGPMLDTALDRHPCHPSLLVLSAVQSSLSGDSEGTASALIRAINLLDNPLRRMLQSQLGHLYMEVGRFSEAAEQFREVCGDDITHPESIPMLLSLSNSKQYRRALGVARRFRNELETPPKTVLGIEAEILAYVGDVKTAAQRYREMCSRSDFTPDDLVRLAMAQFRCGEHSAALEVIADIDSFGLIQNPLALMMLAHLKRFLGVSGYISDAYLSRSHGLRDPNVQMGYIALFLGADKDWEEPSVIEPDCWVRISADGEEKWWYIVEGTEGESEGRKLSPNDDLAQHLLGRSVGDAFDLQQGLGAVSCEVVELQSKYVRAFQEILEEFPMRFPGNPSLLRIRMDDSFTPVFQSVDLRYRYVENIERLYESFQIPFVSFCSLVGNSTLTTWLEYVERTDKQFWFGEGSVQEQEDGAGLLRNACTIILDITALLTVHRLGLSDYLQSRFSSVFIPQLVYDEIQEEAFQMKSSSPPKGFVGKNEEGHYVFTEVPEDAWRELGRYTSSVYDFAKNFERTPSYPILSLDEPEEAIELLRLSGVGAVYLGDEDFEVDSVLISDDLVLSRFARSRDLDVANSQVLLEELLRSGIITEGTYSSKVEELALMNYWFVRIGARDILRSLEGSSYQTTSGLQAMLRTLRGPVCSEDSAATVAADVIDSLAKTSLLYDQFELLSFSVLTEIRKGRHSNSILHEFIDRISFRLELHPLRLDRTLHLVNLLMQAPLP